MNKKLGQALVLIYPAVLVVVGALLLMVSWQKWADVLIDNGREFYIPWRINEGQVLYKDLAYLWGPLPPYVNALLFKLFGTSIMTLAVFNMGIVVVMTFFIYRFLLFTHDKHLAFAGGLVFLTIFVFGKAANEEGGHNYICPYTYSMTYAMFLSFWALDIFKAFLQNSKRYFLLSLMGLVIGLTALTRLEIFIPLAVTLTLGLIVWGQSNGRSMKDQLMNGVFVGAGVLLPFTLAAAYFVQYVPSQHVLLSIVGYNQHWQNVLSLSFYRNQFGVDMPVLNMEIILSQVWMFLVFILGLILISKGASQTRHISQQWQGMAMMGAGVIIIGPGLSLMDGNSAFVLPRALPVIIVFMDFLILKNLFLEKNNDERNRLILVATLTFFATFALVKIMLRSKFAGYGFMYALPGSMVLSIFMLDYLPKQLGKIFYQQALVKIMCLIAICLFCFSYVKKSVAAYAQMTATIAGGRDSMYVLEGNGLIKSAIVKEFLNDVGRVIRQDENMLVLPEGAMLNFLSKRVNPLPYSTFMPAEVFSFGDFKMSSAIFLDPPDNIVFVSRDLWESYRYRNFGDDYLKDSVDWIKANYVCVWQKGGSPFDGAQFGIAIYKYKGRMK